MRDHRSLSLCSAAEQTDGGDTNDHAGLACGDAPADSGKDAPDQFVARRNLPDALGDASFYEPKHVGAETAIAERLADWRARRRATDDERGGEDR